MEQGAQNSGAAGIGPNSGEQTTVQAQKPGVAAATPELIELSRYKELEAFSTKARQNEIALAIELAKANPSKIESYDAKTQNAVAKELYGLDTFAQVKEVYGDDFAKKSNDSDDGEDRTAKLEKELKLFKVKAEYNEVENAIKSLKASNPELLKSESDEVQLRSEMRLLSDKLSPDERVRKAARLAFGDLEANKAKALIDIQSQAGAANTGSAQQKQVTQSQEIEARGKEIAAYIFRGYQKKS